MKIQKVQLFLTTDGKMSHKIRSKKVEKEYYVQVDGIITQEAIEKMKNGVEIGFKGTKYITKPCEAFLIEDEPDIPIENRHIRVVFHTRTSQPHILHIYFFANRSIPTLKK